MGELMTGIACGRTLKKLAGMARPLWERCDPMPLRRAIENRYAGGPRRERQLVQDLYTTYYVGALIAAGEVVTPESVMKAQLGQAQRQRRPVLGAGRPDPYPVGALGPGPSGPGSGHGQL